MKLILQKGIDPTTHETIWVMLDHYYQVVVVIQRYLDYLRRYKSPNTVRAYAYDLRFWWEFLELKSLDWKEVQLSDLETFAHWLRIGDTSKVVSMQTTQAIRSERTVNRATTAITNFYEYHISHKTVDFKQFDRFHMPYGLSNRGLLTGMAKSKPIRQKLIKLKEPKSFPGCLTDEQILTLVDACKNRRDRLIIHMLNSTGMRKGELLGLYRDDIEGKGENYIHIKKRTNPNGARVKGLERTIPVIPQLLKLYNDYLIYEYPVEKASDYVFVNIWEGNIGMPMNPNVLNTMFDRLSKKTGIHVYPHLFRHTFAIRALIAGQSPDRVRHILGHSSIQTTLDYYSHIIDGANLREVVETEEEE